MFKVSESVKRCQLTFPHTHPLIGGEIVFLRPCDIRNLAVLHKKKGRFMKDLFIENLLVSSEFYVQLAKNKEFVKSFWTAAGILLRVISTGGKILIFGNGGSAAEAQHFAAELVCQFEKKRRALPAIALTTDSSILTAQSNDYNFDSVFERQIEALCCPGDVVIGLTTSDVYHNGHSRNIFNAFGAAQKKGAKSIGLFSIKTRNLVSLGFINAAILVPSENTALIQEVHQKIIHAFCGQIEKNL